MAPCSKAPGSTSNFGRYISLIVNFCTVGRFFVILNTADVEGFICLPHHRSTKEHVNFLSTLGADIASALQQWIFAKVKVRETCSSNSETGGLFTFKSWSNLWTEPLHILLPLYFFNRRRWPTSPTFLKLITFYICYNVDMAMFIMLQELFSQGRSYPSPATSYRDQATQVRFMR